MIGRSGDRANTAQMMGDRSRDLRTTRSPDCRSPRFPIGGLLFTRSPDRPIVRLGVSCFVTFLLILAGAGLVNPSMCNSPAEQAAGPASSNSLQEFERQFESSYHAVRTIRAEFIQTYVSGGRTRTESGVVYFARGGWMRWDYRQPQPKLFLSDGKTLMLYVPEEKQLSRSPLKASDDIRVPFRLLLSRLKLGRVFSRLEFAPDALQHQPADRVLRGYPKEPFQEDYQQVLMVISPQFDIRRLIVILPDQSTMEFDFDHIERDVPASRALFQFTPPPGTEVIDQQ